MWSDTELAKRLGITYPIIQGPFGCGISSASLTAMVSNAGGLGSYGANSLAPEEIRDTAAEIRARTDKPFALNLWVPADDRPELSREQLERMRAWFVPYYRELGIPPPSFPKQFEPNYPAQIEALLAAKPRVFSFIFGIPSAEVLHECRKRAIVTIGTATTVEEARALDQAKVDAIVASGYEAGGPSGCFLHSSDHALLGTLALVPQVVDAVKTPVIAAGGIADARGTVAALALGAQAVQIGTAFLACDQSGAPPAHRNKLFSDEAKQTALSRAFSGRPARSIRNRLMDEMAARVANPPYPFQQWFSGTLRTAAISQERTDFIALEAGQAAPLLRHRNAAALMADLVRETPRLLARLSR